MTAEQIAEARALCERATPGPWEIKRSRSGYPYQIHAPNGHHVRDVTRWGAISVPSLPEGEANAAFVAAARTLVPALLDALSPLPERYACQRCGRRDGLDAVVPNEVFATITEGRVLPAGEVVDGRWNLLCLWCIDTLCAEARIECSASLWFAGRAVHGTSQSDAEAEHISRLVAQREEAQSALAGARTGALLLRGEIDALRGMVEERDAEIARRKARKAESVQRGQTIQALEARLVRRNRKSARQHQALCDLRAENERLLEALHVAIHRPMGVVPDEAVEFYNPAWPDPGEQVET